MGCSESKNKNNDAVKADDVTLQEAEPEKFVVVDKSAEAAESPRKTIKATTKPFSQLQAASGTSSGCVIWLHGLSQSGASWVQLELQASGGTDLSWVQWTFPDAAARPVSVLAGDEEPAWFDLSAMPADADAEKAEEGLEAAVAAVHAMLAQAEGLGYPSERVVLGGFAQGAALALLAGRMYDKSLAGIVGWASWLLRPTGLYKPHDANARTPILLCNGEKDESLPIALMHTCREQLQASGADVTHRVVARAHAELGRDSNSDEVRDLSKFLNKRLPKSTKPPKVHASLAVENVGGPHFFQIRIE